MVRSQPYDQLGVGYAQARRPDPHIASQVLDAIGDASTVINIGAGTGNYEPTDRRVVAVEPNAVMVAQRTSPVPVVRAFAETLPFVDDSFDAALAMFTIHHWPDRVAGLAEMGRVAQRQVALVYDSDVTRTFWLVDYFEPLGRVPPSGHPSAEWINDYLPVIEERRLMVPKDCIDGFSGCYWNRPERYLEPDVQAGMSVLARLSESDRRQGSERLAAEIASGEWDRRFGYLRDQSEFDMGYRLVVCGS